MELKDFYYGYDEFFTLEGSDIYAPIRTTKWQLELCGGDFMLAVLYGKIVFRSFTHREPDHHFAMARAYDDWGDICLDREQVAYGLKKLTEMGLINHENFMHEEKLCALIQPDPDVIGKYFNWTPKELSFQERQTARVQNAEPTKPRTGYIYALCEPDGMVRYVGQTQTTLEKRFKTHQSQARNALKKPHQCKKKDKWINELAAQNQEPHIILIEEVTLDALNSREEYWINWYRDNGQDLLNFM